MPDDPHHRVRTFRCLIEEAEVYHQATTASFAIAWSDTAKSAPNGAGLSLNIDLAPLSLHPLMSDTL
jgi:hypothetical protein